MPNEYIDLFFSRYVLAHLLFVVLEHFHDESVGESLLALQHDLGHHLIFLGHDLVCGVRTAHEREIAAASSLGVFPGSALCRRQVEYVHVGQRHVEVARVGLHDYVVSRFLVAWRVLLYARLIDETLGHKTEVVDNVGQLGLELTRDADVHGRPRVCRGQRAQSLAV